MSNYCGIEAYWNVCKNTLCLIGQWPYQLPVEKIIIRIICSGVNALIFVPGMIGIYEVRKESIAFMECIPPLLTLIGGIVYPIFLSFNMSKMRSLTDRMKCDWKSLEACKSELEVLKKATQKGKSITTIFAIYAYMSTTFYVISPLLPQLLDIIWPLNETRQREYLFQVNYVFMENANNYNLIVFHAIMASYITMTTIISGDFMFLLFVQHASGMFQLLRYRLYQVVDGDNRARSGDSIEESKVRQKLVLCIQLYNHILKFTDDIQSCFSTMYLIGIGINMTVISFQGVQIVLNFHNAEILTRFGSFFLGQITHLFFTSVPGQILIDESSKVRHYCYDFNWTAMTVKSQKLLLFMLVKSSRECNVSAGNIYIISMENFSATLKTAFSYLSVLSSTQ